MTRHDDMVALRHMRDHALEAVTAARNRSRQDLDGDRIFSLALIKLVEIVGEAASRVSLATRALEPRIPWNEIVAARNRLVHGYDQVDLDVLWRIVAVELPPLIQQLETILTGHSK
ncbi:MAG TPA: HepT-like ribonuclease domain-containing protein [Candidatus Bathyarchaeia archaeon]|nr:HepT-like ribonuclease domain-containing protein [Candidatus Bathyarchaeia archaeon]